MILTALSFKLVYLLSMMSFPPLQYARYNEPVEISRKTKFFFAKILYLWQKMLNFAHSDAEAPPAVFLFHRIFIFKRREG